MKAPVSWMAKNHVAANLLMGFIMLSGLFAMMQTKKETFPEMSLDQVQIQVPYLGATPAEVEDAVCKRIEERVRGLEGVRRVRSTAAEGMGVVSIELERGADMDKLLDDIKNEIDRIDTFPAEIEEPVIKELTRRNQAIDVVLYGDVEEKALKVAAELVRDDLRSSGVISQVELKGVRVDEIAIEVSEEALRRYGLTFAQVANAVRRTSIDLPAGSVESEDGAILLRTQGLMRSGREYEEVVVLTRPDGTALKLKDVATVVDGFEDTDLVSRFNGQPAAVVQVFRIGDQNALDISAYVHQYIEDKRPTLPAGNSHRLRPRRRAHPAQPHRFADPQRPPRSGVGLHLSEPFPRLALGLLGDDGHPHQLFGGLRADAAFRRLDQHAVAVRLYRGLGYRRGRRDHRRRKHLFPPRAGEILWPCRH